MISSRVPGIVAQAIQTLQKGNLSDNTHYAFHTGGRKVLDAIQEHNGLADEQMLPSRTILREYGNMSSPSVLFVLKSILNEKLRDKESVACFAFGAGFLASMLQAEWQS